MKISKKEGKDEEKNETIINENKNDENDTDRQILDHTFGYTRSPLKREIDSRLNEVRKEIMIVIEINKKEK
jgi:hypothetical protein